MESKQAVVPCVENPYRTEIVVVEESGFILELEYQYNAGVRIDEPKVLAASAGDRQIVLGQFVVSNGRYLEKGLRGVVEEIRRPNVKGCSSDIFCVLFEGSRSTRPVHMKIKDLEV